MSIASALDESREYWEDTVVYDWVTGLYSRAYLFGRLAKECARSRRHGDPLTLMLVDLDDFKVINEALGRPQGDLVLAEVGRLLTSLVRETDMVGRTGGDEFALVLPITDEAGARVLIPRIASGLASIKMPASSDGLAATTALAVSSPAKGLMQAEDLYRTARMALDAEKRHIRTPKAIIPLRALEFSFAGREAIR